MAVDHRQEIGDAVDHIVRARTAKPRHRRLPARCELVGRKRLGVGQRQAEHIAGDRYADRPAAAIEALGDADLGVVDLDAGPGRPDRQLEERLVEHERRRAAVGRVAGADEAVGRKALRGRDRQDLGHDLARVAGGRADLQAAAA